LFVCLLAIGQPTVAQSSPPKPNILVILADDLRHDCIGPVNPRIHTPNIDRLARAGVLFSNGYIMGGNSPAVCTPSRTMLMSGRTLFHLPRDISAAGNKPSVPVMSTVFRQAGYETFYCGKHGNTYHPADRSFDKTVFIDRRDVPNQVAEHRSYPTSIVSYLADPARAARPFFIFYAPSIPHDPLQPEPDDLALYAGDKRPPLPPNAAVEHAAVAGFNLRDTNIRTYDVPGMGNFKTPLNLEQWSDVLARYYAYVTGLDRQVGLLLDELERTGAAQNTIVVFTSDNGHSFSDNGLIHKQSVYEQDLRVPLIVRGPGIPAGKRSDALVYISDLFPTLCKHIGIPVPETVETKSFQPSLATPGKSHRTTLYHAYREEMRAFRDDQYKIILFDNRRVRLFDLKADPFEMRDLAQDAEHSERVARMTNQARHAGKELGDDPVKSPFWKNFTGKPTS
jgi:arylsulfatase A-like enzyme